MQHHAIIAKKLLIPTLFVSFFTVLCNCLSTTGGYRSENSSLEEIVNAYFSSIDSIATSRALRLGVLPFVAAGKTENGNNEFGNYFSEKLTNRMTAVPEKIKLYERNRLDALLKEHSLEMSGMISEADARKLGKLIPIDYILTGTYTVLGTQLAISGRLIDVTSGEIIFSMNNECPIHDEFAALLPKPGQDTPQNETVADTRGERPSQCEALQEKFNAKIQDLPAQSQFTAMIREGMKIPFDTGCRQIHYDIMERCRRERTNPPVYTKFLINVLDEITDAWKDPRGIAIFRYFRADNTIDDTEWESALSFMKKVKWVDRYLGLLFIGDTLSPQIEKRMHELITRCKDGEIGSTAIPFDVALYSAVKSLRLNYEGGFGRGATPPGQKRRAREFIRVLDMFKNQPFDSIPQLYCDGLIRQWHREKYSPLGDSLLKRACMIIRKCPPVKSKDPVKSIASALVWDVFKTDSTREFNHAARHAMDYFARTGKEAIARTTRQMDPIERDNSKVPEFCLATGITSPVIITADSISIMLSSEDRTTRRIGFENLYYLGKRASMLQKKLTRLLRQRSGKPSGSGRDNEYLVKTIGAIAPNDPETIHLLVSLLDNASPYFPLSDVTDALACIGEPAVPSIKNYFEKKMDSHVFYTAQFFEGMGKAALPYCAYLQTKAAACSNPKTRYRLEDAVERIRAQK